LRKTARERSWLKLAGAGDLFGEAGGLAWGGGSPRDRPGDTLAGGEVEALAVGRPGISVAVAEEVEGQEAVRYRHRPAAGGDGADLALVEVVERAALEWKTMCLPSGSRRVRHRGRAD
jgi:hypothetical protein